MHMQMYNHDNYRILYVYIFYTKIILTWTIAIVTFILYNIHDLE